MFLINIIILTHLTQKLKKVRGKYIVQKINLAKK